MRYAILHETTYAYSEAVFLEPHTLRFRPQTTAYAKPESFALSLGPAPAGIRHQADAEANLIAFAWFAGLTESLTIRAESILVTTDYNPLGFILDASSFAGLSPNYDATQRAVLYAALTRVAVGPQLAAFGDDVAGHAEGDVVGFVLGLTQAIARDFEVVYREVGAPMDPDETYALRRGSCRDLSWMLIALLRHRGFAARFASGYFFFEMEPPAYELHAWVEVFILGAGWFGVDPTHGLATGNAHLPLAASADPALTMPVTGGIRGEATASLATRLSITTA